MFTLFSFAMTSGLSSVLHEFKFRITMRQAQNLHGQGRTKSTSNFWQILNVTIWELRVDFGELINAPA